MSIDPKSRDARIRGEHDVVSRLGDRAIDDDRRLREVLVDDSDLASRVGPQARRVEPHPGRGLAKAA